MATPASFFLPVPDPDTNVVPVCSLQPCSVSSGVAPAVGQVQRGVQPPPAALETHPDNGQFQILNCIYFFHDTVKTARKH